MIMHAGENRSVTTNLKCAWLGSTVAALAAALLVVMLAAQMAQAISATGGMVTNTPLAVSGSVTGLTNVALYVSFDPKVRASDVAGKVFTILACVNDVSAMHFGTVTWAAPATKGTVIYANGAVQLANIGIPVASSVMMVQRCVRLPVHGWWAAPFARNG